VACKLQRSPEDDAQKKAQQQARLDFSRRKIEEVIRRSAEDTPALRVVGMDVEAVQPTQHGYGLAKTSNGYFMSAPLPHSDNESATASACSTCGNTN
jgi:hypothetical protein